MLLTVTGNFDPDGQVAKVTCFGRGGSGEIQISWYQPGQRTEVRGLLVMKEVFASACGMVILA